MDRTASLSPRRSSSPPRGAQAARETGKRPTKEILIEVAERLFGRHGFDGVSLREITAAARQANSYAVQYHFKDKTGLIGAILESRVRRIEILRLERLKAFKASRKHDPRDLLAILWLPTLAIRDDEGSYTFCRFLLQHTLQPDVAQHPIYKLFETPGRSGGKRKRTGSSILETTMLLRECHKDIPPGLFARRLSALSLMFLSSVVEFDNARPRAKARVEFDAGPILDMAAAALAAPP